jgi:hypothetical protein
MRLVPCAIFRCHLKRRHLPGTPLPTARGGGPRGNVASYWRICGCITKSDSPPWRQNWRVTSPTLVSADYAPGTTSREDPYHPERRSNGRGGMCFLGYCCRPEDGCNEGGGDLIRVITTSDEQGAYNIGSVVPLRLFNRCVSARTVASTIR